MEQTGFTSTELSDMERAGHIVVARNRKGVRQFTENQLEELKNRPDAGFKVAHLTDDYRVRTAIAEAIKRGQIKGFKRGSMWVVARSDVESATKYIPERQYSHRRPEDAWNATKTSYVSIGAAARELAIPEDTIRALCTSGLVKYYRTRRMVRVDENSLKRVLHRDDEELQQVLANVSTWSAISLVRPTEGHRVDSALSNARFYQHLGDSNARRSWQGSPNELVEYMRRYRMTTRGDYVYFLRDRNSGFIKIGMCADVRKRMIQIAATIPGEFEVLAITQGGIRFERHLHECFDEYRVHSEWFMPGPRLVAWISRCLKIKLDEDGAT